MRLALLSFAAFVLLAGCSEPSAEPARSEAELTAAIEQWRQERDASLREPYSWLTLVGLHFLDEGENPFGAGPDNTVVLPEGKAPERAGVFVVEGDEVAVRAQPGVEITVDGEPVTERDLVHDGGGTREPTLLDHGPLRFFAVERGGRLAIRVRDSLAKTRTEFAGLEYFPPAAEWAIPAQFERLAEPREERIENSIGQNVAAPVAGLFHFEKGGEPYTLELTLEGSEYYVMFGDRTNGESTYSGGRFIRIGELPPDGPFTLDFNQAYNPPCVFTPYATCPRPTRQNRLPIAVEAGEKMYDAGYGSR